MKNKIYKITGVLLVISLVPVFLFLVFGGLLTLLRDPSFFSILYSLPLVVVPAALLFVALYYLYIGFKNIEVNKFVYFSAITNLITSIISFLALFVSIGGCILYPDPLCFVFGVPFVLAGGLVGIVGIILFFIGIVLKFKSREENK